MKWLLIGFLQKIIYAKRFLNIHRNLDQQVPQKDFEIWKFFT